MIRYDLIPRPEFCYFFNFDIASFPEVLGALKTHLTGTGGEEKLEMYFLQNLYDLSIINWQIKRESFIWMCSDTKHSNYLKAKSSTPKDLTPEKVGEF